MGGSTSFPCVLSRPSRAPTKPILCARCSSGPLSQTSRPRAPVAITSILLRVRTLSSPRSNLLNTFSRGNKITASRGRESHARKTIRRDARGDHFFRARTETVAAERHARRARDARQLHSRQRDAVARYQVQRERKPAPRAPPSSSSLPVQLPCRRRALARARSGARARAWSFEGARARW